MIPSVKPGDMFTASMIDFNDIGSKIRVETISGAVIEDVLVGVHLGVTGRHERGTLVQDAIYLLFRNVMPVAGYDNQFGPGPFQVDPDATVTVIEPTP